MAGDRLIHEQLFLKSGWKPLSHCRQQYDLQILLLENRHHNYRQHHPYIRPMRRYYYSPKNHQDSRNMSLMAGSHHDDGHWIL